MTAVFPVKATVADRLGAGEAKALMIFLFAIKMNVLFRSFGSLAYSPKFVKDMGEIKGQKTASKPLFVFLRLDLAEINQRVIDFGI